MTAIEKYSKDDFEVVLFGKILQNKVDEEFLMVKKEIEKSISDIAKVRPLHSYYCLHLNSNTEDSNQKKVS